MCGIAGLISFNPTEISEETISGMLAKIKHRGPDGEGVFIEKNVGLGHVRLSIIDVSKESDQPFFSTDERYVLVFNGEIYNYIELRKELEQHFIFKTTGDSEVLLNSYVHWGEQCLDRLNGMFSFAIYDRQEEKVFLARDRFGVKPLYYWHDAESLIFASEPVAIISAMKVKPTADFQRIFDFLTFNRTDHDPQTFFQGISKLPHAHKMVVDKDGARIEKWYDLSANIKTDNLSPNAYADLLTDSVRLRMRSDVPVGLTLSGGLDSSSIASILIHRLDRTDVQTFSAVYGKGKKADESDFIDLYRDQLQTMHFIKPEASELLHDLNDFVKAQQEPFGSTSIYASYTIMKNARGKVKVMLNGQGADECLAGYEDFNGIYYIELLRSLKFKTLVKENFIFLARYKSIYALKACLYYLLPGQLQNRIRLKEKKYIKKDFADRYGSTSSIPGKIFSFKNINKALLGHMEHKLEHLLKWDDRNAMRFGIEGRNPFLDYRLVERTLGLPSSEKIKNGYTKAILRDAMKGILPEQIRLRKDKVGFATPEDEWFRLQAFREFINEVLNSESFKTRGIIDPEIAKELYASHLRSEINISREIWKWINLELWFRQFID